MTSMKFKSTLWTLAVALTVVSCSDEFDEKGGGNDNGGELTGPATYMTVSISSNATTKANPSGGEEGDEPGGEIGERNEYKVNDVTVILYTDENGNEPTTFSNSSKLVAAGYKDGIANMETSGQLWHSRTTATVTITVTDPAQANSFDGKTYGVITVTNLGSEGALCNRIKADDISTGEELANFLQVKAWDDTKGFVMSTHNDTYNINTDPTGIFDKVTLKAGVDATNAPTASVHVERLAAKIRINEAEGVNDFVYTVNDNSDSEAKVRLDDVAIVNKLTSGTYLLKRVTKVLEDGYASLPEDAANDILLANEFADVNGVGLNYVIDPWTRAKSNLDPSNLPGGFTDFQAAKDALNGANLTMPSTNATLSYDNDFAGEDYSAMWNSFEDTKGLASYTGEYPLFLAYTQENTTSLAMQKNGYSTGAIFKATYFPKKWAVTTSEVTADKTIGKVEAEDIDYTPGEDGTGYENIDGTFAVPADFKFYVYEGNVYKDYKTIFNQFVWTQQKSLDKNTDNIPIYSYSDFTAANIVNNNIKVADFFGHLLAEFSDPLGYLDYLKEKYDTNSNGVYDEGDDTYSADPTFTADDAIDTYTTANVAAINEVVLPYEGGVCYYPYWIRHASNGIPTEMSVMEFAIVRNNIYDMTVTRISGLGLSGAEKPDPDKDDEDEKYYFNVEIYVKNWVVRSNSDIIL